MALTRGRRALLREVPAVRSAARPPRLRCFDVSASAPIATRFPAAFAATSSIRSRFSFHRLIELMRYRWRSGTSAGHRVSVIQSTRLDLTMTLAIGSRCDGAAPRSRGPWRFRGGILPPCRRSPRWGAAVRISPAPFRRPGVRSPPPVAADAPSVMRSSMPAASKPRRRDLTYACLTPILPEGRRAVPVARGRPRWSLRPN